jgi:hypothetical protein
LRRLLRQGPRWTIGQHVGLVCIGEIGALHGRSAQICSAEVRSAQVRRSQPGVAKNGSTEVGATEVRVGEVGGEEIAVL